MKDVYEKTPQMGDPASLEPQIAETLSNIERLKLDVQKYEVRKDPGEWREPACLAESLPGGGRGGVRGSGIGEVFGAGGLQLFSITALAVHG